jgi:hypothetical protein
LRQRSASASSFSASQPPMLASGSFLGRHGHAVGQGGHLADDVGDRDALVAGLAVLMNQAFSAIRQASRNSGLPNRSQTSRTARTLAMLTGLAAGGVVGDGQHHQRDRGGLLCQ